MNQELYITAISAPITTEIAADGWQNFYELHKLVYKGFPDKQTATKARVLYRFDIDGDHGYICVQSKTPPDWSKLPPFVKVSGPVPLQLPPCNPGDKLRFRLLAKPSWKTPRKHPQHKNRRFALSEEPEQRDWLNRKGDQHGFKIEQVSLTDRVWFDTKVKEYKSDGSPKELHAVQFDGILTVTDKEALLQAVANGVGPQKSYGFGLLSLAPIP
ncbi:MAG: type I-E CRISPR-associated protein Cas6/Cse3/CasE [Armatimonadetes bacterium]|nr:type I-E CRISPR-associated protein Cas6/Cse3/CasE [Armatimonadota bacterium]